MELCWIEALYAVGIVALGTAVQASIGFGLAMIAAPLLVLVNREFVPGPMIAAALGLGVWMVLNERRALDFTGFGSAVAGRLLGTPLAALLLGSLSAAAFDLVFGALVMLAVLISLVHPHVRPTARVLFWAGAASGFMGTLSSIGGPPLALVYQNAPGPALRANLAALFVIGCLMSLIALALVGRFQTSDLGYAGILLGGIALGVVLSGPLRRRLDKGRVRPLLLGLCFLSALVVMLRAVIGLV